MGHAPIFRRAEDDLILSLARLDPSPLTGDILAHTSARLRWRYIFSEARGHGVAPLLYHNLRRLALLPALPARVAEDFRREYYRTSAVNLLLSRSLRDILGSMARRRIPVLPFKGALFMHTLYPLIALRPMIDLDILVREGDFSRASEALADMEYRMVFNPLRPRSAAEYYAMAFENKKKGVVELHRALYRHFGHPLDIDGIWKRSRGVRGAGRAAAAMSPEDTVLMICLHLAQHDFRIRLISLVDLSEIVSRHAGHLRWGRLLDRAESRRVTVPVFLALSLVKEWFGRDIPAKVLERVRPSAPRRAYLFSLYDRRNPRFLRWDLPERVTQVLLLPALADSPLRGLRFAGTYLGLRARDAIRPRTP